jgi:hypothetical protein
MGMLGKKSYHLTELLVYFVLVVLEYFYHVRALPHFWPAWETFWRQGNK